MMEYKNPSIKVEWHDTQENITPERIKRVKEYFQKKYNSTNVKILPVNGSNNANTKLQSLDVSDNILDPQYQKSLIKDFLKENKIDIKWELIDRLDNKVNSEIEKINVNKVRYNKWFIKKIEFSNFLSFGDNNVIDFEELDGITVIESTPKNFGGKTSLSIDLMLFLFFNKTTKTDIILDTFNKHRDADELSVKGYIVIDGEDYIIERNCVRKKGKSGEYTVKSELKYTKTTDTGEIVNLNGEKRPETEKFITSAIGTEEDFLSTILTTARNLEDLIDSKPTERGLTLTKFLGLESLKQKEVIAKGIFTNWSKTLVSNTYNIVKLNNDNENFQSLIDDSTKKSEELKIDLLKYEETLSKLEEERDHLLLLKNNDIDKELFLINPVALKEEIKKLIKEQKEFTIICNSIIVTEPSRFYLEDEHDDLKTLIKEKEIKSRVDGDEIIRNETLIQELENGKICPTCKQLLADVDHTEEIETLKKTNQERKVSLELINEELVKLNENDSVLQVLKKEYEEYERTKLRKLKCELEVEQRQLIIDSKDLKIKRFEDNKKKLDDNLRIDAELITLRSKIESETGSIRITNTNIEKLKNDIISYKEKIEINLELIKKIKAEEELIGVFKLYLSIYGKNGISKVIMKNMIPLLNQELQRLLSDSCYFTVEFNVNESNELVILMIDNETRVVQSIKGGSGYEKTVAALAIRSVLTKVSALPKPNIVVMDEIFGKTADENLDMLGELFKKIKNYFEHIIVISHNPLVRNWSDNILMVRKVENISSIEFITTKIS
jgi:DNA repair exonuclease SbcCD ATPase subunit